MATAAAGAMPPPRPPSGVPPQKPPDRPWLPDPLPYCTKHTKKQLKLDKYLKPDGSEYYKKRLLCRSGSSSSTQKRRKLGTGFAPSGTAATVDQSQATGTSTLFLAPATPRTPWGLSILDRLTTPTAASHDRTLHRTQSSANLTTIPQLTQSNIVVNPLPQAVTLGAGRGSGRTPELFGGGGKAPCFPQAPVFDPNQAAKLLPPRPSLFDASFTGCAPTSSALSSAPASSQLSKLLSSPSKKPLPKTPATPDNTAFKVGGFLICVKDNQDSRSQAQARDIIQRFQRQHRADRNADREHAKTPEPDVLLEAIRVGITAEAIMEAAGTPSSGEEAAAFLPFGDDNGPALFRRSSATSLRLLLPRGSQPEDPPSLGEPLYFPCESCYINRSYCRRLRPGIDECIYDEDDLQNYPELFNL
jgi:hypothetical protein